MGAATMLQPVLTALIGISDGVSILEALPVGIGFAVLLMLAFGAVAGDAVGELPSLIVGFFIMTVFFTGTIALLY